MAHIKNPLRSPHPFIFNSYSIAIPAVVTWVVLLLFKPLGFHQLPSFKLFIISSLLAVIVGSSIWMLVVSFRYFIPQWMDPENWTVGKEVALALSVLSLIIVIVYSSILWLNLSEQSASLLFVAVVVKTIAMSTFPILILVLYEQYDHQKKQLKKAEELNKLLPGTASLTSEAPLIQLHGENGKLVIQLTTKELICLKSDGNYVEVYYAFGSTAKKELIRNRLKNMINQLPKGCFFQCHKRFIINGYFVMNVHGNARNYELTLKNLQDRIPVSRSKTEELTIFLQELN